MDIIEKWNANFRALEAEDAEARRNGTLVGRYIKEPIADGYAFYKIVKENKATVKIQVVTDIGDDWRVPYWGNSTTIPKSYAIKSIGMEDKLAELFSRKK